MAAGRKVLPWIDTNPRAEQERFIMAYLEEREDFSALCRGFGISRKTGYKRLKRYQEWGFEGLGDLSRAPHSHPREIAMDVEELVVAARLANPTWGPKKLVAWLREREAPSPLAGAQHGGEHPEPASIDQASPEGPADPALEPALQGGLPPQPSVVRRLQGPIQDRRWSGGVSLYLG